MRKSLDSSLTMLLKKLFIISVSMLLISVSCNKSGHIRDKKNEEQLNTLNGNYTFETNNYCSSNLLFDENAFGNIILSITPNKNFLKCTAISDNEFVFSCGRGKKEVIISKFNCQSNIPLDFDGVGMPKLEYDDEDILVLYEKAGSDSWVNYFIDIIQEKVFSEKALFIDYEYRKYIYLDSKDYKNGNAFFVIHDIMSDTRQTVKTNYYKYRKDGYPALYINSVKLKNDTIYYNIEKGGLNIQDNISIN